MLNIDWRVKKFDELNLFELYDMMILRQEVFVVEQNCPYLDADGLDLKSIHISGYFEGKLIAYARIIPPGVEYKDEFAIGRVICDLKYRNTGLGKALMNQCFKEIGNYPIKIHAQKYLEQFYSSLGFNPIGEEYLLDNIPHIEMERKSN